MHHYNCIVDPLIVMIASNFNAIWSDSCSGTWVWLIIILVVVSCTDLFLYFLHLFSNFIQLVLILFTPVQLK